MREPRTALTPLMRSVRDRHVESILRVLLQGDCGRKELGRRTGISFTTITRLTTLLLDAGIIAERPRTTATRAGRGRPEVPLGIPDDGKVVIGCHIARDVVHAGAFSLRGEPLFALTAPTPEGSADDTLAAARDLVSAVQSEYDPERVLAVGVSTGGVIDHESGRLIRSPLFPWSDVDMRTPLAQTTGMPIIVDSTVRSFALERLWWADEAPDSLLVVFVGGVIASAMIVDRHLHRGPGAMAGDVSHLPVPGGPGFRCPCGALDCAGVAVTADAILRQAKARGILPADADLTALTPEDPDAPAGIRELFRVRAERLGDLVARLIAVIGPDVTVIAGNIGTDDDARLCLATARQRSIATTGADPDIELSRLTPAEWLRGAAAMALDAFLRSPTSFSRDLLE
ncbi:ROK family protein [Microbacterium awajiense]|uniref:ROK family protein n=1 Tax=Microbacterium awajiense TaxID=415214 RepID=A0ABP7AR58_9MICO